MDNQNNQEKPKQVKQKSPLDLFFKLGSLVTKNDPIRKINFDYYMLWIIFLAFFGVFIGNIIMFIKTHQVQYLGWTMFGFALIWFQYFNLQSMYNVRKTVCDNQDRINKINLDKKNNDDQDCSSLESNEDMLKGFESMDNKTDNEKYKDI